MNRVRAGRKVVAPAEIVVPAPYELDLRYVAYLRI